MERGGGKRWSVGTSNLSYVIDFIEHAGGEEMEIVAVEKAVGMVLCHDMTQIVPGKFKGCAFRKGHVIKNEDIPRLLDMGKEHIYAWDLRRGYIHEDDAAHKIAFLAAGKGTYLTEAKEGKVEIKAEIDGLLKINEEALCMINEIEQIALSTIHGNRAVTKGKKIAGTRIIPLVIEEKYLSKINHICKKYGPIIQIEPFESYKVGMITTGSEVYSGRIKDKFGPVVKEKFQNLGSQVIEQIFVPDSIEEIVKAIHLLLEKGAEMIAVTGGMSVDPDDLTPSGIKAAGGVVETYGAPVLPGAMFMLAHIGDIPVVGLPGCVMYYKASVFDLIVPRILAGETITRKEIAKLAYGGMCLGCDDCRYPDCSFGA